MKRLLCNLLLVIIFVSIFTGCNSIKSSSIQTATETTISIDKVSLQREDEGFKEKIAPNKPEGYYDLYEYYEGYRYYAISGKAKNNSIYDFSADTCFLKASNDKTVFDAKIVFMNENESEFTNILKAGQEQKYVIFTLLKDDQDIDNFNIYYNNNFEVRNNKKKFDKQIIVDVKD